MEEKNCEDVTEKEELPQKRKLTEKQRKALEEGREKRRQVNAERRKQDNKLVDLQAKYEQAREENLRIREEIIQSKLEKITHETRALAEKTIIKASPIETNENTSPEKPPPPAPTPVIEKPIAKPFIATKSTISQFNCRTVDTSSLSFV